jgi:hypothetical protein
VNEHFSSYGALSTKEISNMRQLAETHGEDAIVSALESFEKRPKGFVGLNNVWAAFFKEADQHIAQGKFLQSKTQRRRTSDAGIQKARDFESKLLAEMRTCKYPFSEEEIAKLKANLDSFFSEENIALGINIEAMLQEQELWIRCDWKKREEEKDAETFPDLWKVAEGDPKDYLS